LLYQKEGVDLLRVDSPPDANKGPECRATVSQLTEGSWLIDVHCTTWNASCGGTYRDGNGIVSHRYTQTERTDQNWTAKYTCRGKVRLRSDVRVSADSLRSLVIPKIPEKYIRSDLSFTLSEDGLELDYAFDDVPQHVMPPAPATEARGRFVALTSNGAKLMGQMTLTLKAPADVDRKSLIGVASKLAYDRLMAAGVPLDKDNKPSQIFGYLAEDTHGETCSVEVSMQSILQNPSVPFAQAYTKLGFGQTPGSTNDGIAPPVRQKLAPLLAAAFLDPCGESFTTNTM
jgi:hypothetical protein